MNDINSLYTTYTVFSLRNHVCVCARVCFQEEEFYVCVYAAREGDYVLFHHEGGVEVGDVDAKAQRLLVAVDDKLSEEQVTEKLLTHVSDEKKGYDHVTSSL